MPCPLHIRCYASCYGSWRDNAPHPIQTCPEKFGPLRDDSGFGAWKCVKQHVLLKIRILTQRRRRNRLIDGSDPAVRKFQACAHNLWRLQRFDRRYLLRRTFLRFFKFIMRLEIKPKLRFYSKVLSQAQCCVCSYTAFAVDDLIYAARRNANRYSQLVLGDFKAVNEVLQDDLTRMNWSV